MKKYILITGAVGGLGKAFVHECASRGFNLALTDVSEENLNILAAHIRSIYDVDILIYPCNLICPVSIKGFESNIRSDKVELCGLINVAGIDFEGYFCDLSSEEAMGIIKLNIESLVFLTHFALSIRNPDTTFRIINISSLGAFCPIPYKALYSSSKRFILNFSYALREDLKRKNCTVTVVCPGGMPTNEIALKRINAQKLMGRLTSLNTGFVTYKAMSAALKGRLLCIPGIFNKLIYLIGFLIPPSIGTHILGKRWSKFHM